jgi:subtilase family serine protease
MRTPQTFFVAAMLASAGCSDARKPLNPAAVLSNPRLDGATDLGPTSRDQMFDFVLGLQLRNQERLHKFLDEQPQTQDVLSPEDFAQQFAPTTAEYDKLANWLRAQGLEITRLTSGRTTISVRGNAETIERAFAVAIHDYRDGSGVFSAANGPLGLIQEVGASISGSVGLHGEFPWVSHMVRPTPQASPLGGDGPQDLETLYSAWNGSTATVANPGKGETVAILGAGLPPNSTDLPNYFTSAGPYKLTKFPGTYTQQLVGGPNRDPQATAQNEQGENQLDISMVAAFAPYAAIVHVITATNSPGLFTDGISYIVNQLPAAHAVSVSYGTCERGSAGEFPVVNALLAQAKAQGQLWFFAAGDSGADGCRDGANNLILSAGWPASSPYAVGVGGTQVDNTNGTSPTFEVTWGGNGGGGGGASESFDKPAYQMTVTPNDNSRDEPDVSALAGSPGVSCGGCFGPVEGTSAATPMWAGIWALIDQAKGGGKGLPMGLESLYKLGAASKGFQDITYGSNGGPSGGYPAMPNYDRATGWGSPNVAALISNWQ